MTRTADIETAAMKTLLPDASPNGAARRAALNALDSVVGTPTTMITYTSRGAVLVIGEKPASVEAATRLQAQGLTALILVPKAAGAGTPVRAEISHHPDGYTVAEGRISDLLGHLGAFIVRLEGGQAPVNLAREAGFSREDFDLVLDLQSQPALEHEVLPPGYYAPRGDPQAVSAALEELSDLVGEYEKPKYFRYDPNICAHKARGIVGCQRCIEACPTNAIVSLAEAIEVDPYLCQGGGSCATACPTGAITYAFPSVSDLLSHLRAALRTYADCGGRDPWLLFHDADAGRQWLSERVQDLSDAVIPVEVEEIGSVGMDTWFSALAYGAAGVAWLITDATPRSVMREVEQQQGFANAILCGMGYPEDRLVAVRTDSALLRGVAEGNVTPLVPAAGFAGFDEKRTTIRLALDHLFAHAPHPRKSTPLPESAPFGTLKVDREACTLCMGCVAVCPAAALADGEDLPQLRFIEANCVQCGLCARACPENAIQLVPKFTYDAQQRGQTRVLNEEEAFLCLECGKPFATQSMMRRMQEKLKGHWMYQDAAALRRLSMCEDCRIRSVYANGGRLNPFPDRGPHGQK